MKSNHYLCEEEDTTAETLRYEDKSMRTHTVYTALHQVLFDLTKPPLWIPTLFDGLMMQWSGVLYSVWASIFSSPKDRTIGSHVKYTQVLLMGELCKTAVYVLQMHKHQSVELMMRNITTQKHSQNSLLSFT